MLRDPCHLRLEIVRANAERIALGRPETMVRERTDAIRT
jgi:hypothetical protein